MKSLAILVAVGLSFSACGGSHPATAGRDVDCSGQKIITNKFGLYPFFAPTGALIGSQDKVQNTGLRVFGVPTTKSEYDRLYFHVEGIIMAMNGFEPDAVMVGNPQLKTLKVPKECHLEQPHTNWTVGRHVSCSGAESHFIHTRHDAIERLTDRLVEEVRLDDGLWAFGRTVTERELSRLRYETAEQIAQSKPRFHQEEGFWFMTSYKTCHLGAKS